MSKIDVNSFHFYYSEFQALRNISLQVEANEILALIGPSGCGKTTFLRTLNRMNDFVKVQPEFILMDEPTAALDPIATAKIEELIQELVKRYTIIIVTHNMQQAGRVSDHTSFFLNGKIIETDVTEKIFSNPSDQRTEDYITGRFG